LMTCKQMQNRSEHGHRGSMTKPAITMDRTGLDTDTTTETKAISNTIDGSREARIESTRLSQSRNYGTNLVSTWINITTPNKRLCVEQMLLQIVQNI
jgi:hypothetical protein